MTYAKYSASGNDFIIAQAIKTADRRDLARALCDRQNGIGADGFILLKPHDKLDFEWEFYNSDGSRAEMCGNGARAAAHFAFYNEIAGENMRFLTLAGEISAKVEGDFVSVGLGGFTIEPRAIDDAGKKWRFVNTGVPHIVSQTGDLAAFDTLPLAKLRAKYNANVNLFAQKDGALFVRTFERGVEGETLACGTGMAACFAAALAEKIVENPAKIYPKSGEEIRLELVGDSLMLSGKVKKVFDAVLS
ncbi:diaminopimelate epimerase [Campylobacterota bacterium]|nr:diaminopimelate epimerase [Campylobacterota bacterium]